MTSHHDVAGLLPVIPDEDSDFTPDLARKIVAKYQALLETQAKALSEAETLAFRLNSGEELQSLMRLNNEVLTRALAAEARLAEAMRVIEPFTVEYLNQVHPDWALATWVTFTVGELRAARAFTNAAKEKT